MGMTGVLRSVQNGKILMPMCILREFGLKEGDTLEFEIRGNEIVAKVYDWPDYGRDNVV